MASAAQAISLGAALESMRGRLVTLTSDDDVEENGEEAGEPGDESDSGEEEEDDDDEEEEEEDSDNEFDDEEEQEQEQEGEGEGEAEG